MRILSFHENSELFMGGCAVSSMVWAIIILRDEGDMLKMGSLSWVWFLHLDFSKF